MNWFLISTSNNDRVRKSKPFAGRIYVRKKQQQKMSLFNVLMAAFIANSSKNFRMESMNFFSPLVLHRFWFEQFDKSKFSSFDFSSMAVAVTSNFELINYIAKKIHMFDAINEIISKHLIIINFKQQQQSVRQPNIEIASIVFSFAKHTFISIFA